MIDTHAHIFDDQFNEDIGEVIEHCKSVGITHILLPNIDLCSIDAMLELSKLSRLKIVMETRNQLM